MDLSMAVSAHSFQVVKAKSDVRIVDVLRSQFGFVMNYLRRFKYSVFKAPLTEMVNVFHIGCPAVIPGIGTIKLT